LNIGRLLKKTQQESHITQQTQIEIAGYKPGKECKKYNKMEKQRSKKTKITVKEKIMINVF
jgi:hypothetical protein